MTAKSDPKRISATDARVHFGEVLRSVAETEAEYVVERSGSPIAAVVSYGEFRRLKRLAGEADNSDELPTWYLNMVKVATEFRDAHRGEPQQDSVELIRAMREERDAELLESLS